MRRLHLAAAVILAGVTTAGQAADIAIAPGETLLEVESEGKVVVSPDAALVTIGMVSTGPTARQATAANATDMTRVVKAIREAGIDPRYIRTDQINVSPRFARQADGDWQGQAQITGYVAQNSVSVTVTQIGKASAVIDAAFGAGANSVSGPNLTLLDDRAALDKARRDAIDAAKAEAASYADGLGMKVSRVLRVSERGASAEPERFIVVTGKRLGGAAEPAPPPPPPPPPVSGGEMRQSVTVWIDFALVPRG